MNPAMDHHDRAEKVGHDGDAERRRPVVHLSGLNAVLPNRSQEQESGSEQQRRAESRRKYAARAANSRPAWKGSQPTVESATAKSTERSRVSRFHVVQIIGAHGLNHPVNQHQSKRLHSKADDDGRQDQRLRQGIGETPQAVGLAPVNAAAAAPRVKPAMVKMSRLAACPNKLIPMISFTCCAAAS